MTETTFDKVASASSRFKPYETIVFATPLVGLNGNKLISYQWAYEWTMIPNHEGELVSKRVSDWGNATSNDETGREIVHQFTVEKTDGQLATVSSETVPVLLGYLDAKALKVLPSLVSAVKTMAKQQMLLGILEAQNEKFLAIKKEVEALPLPEIKLAELADLPYATQQYVKRDGDRAPVYFKMGSLVYPQYSDNRTTPDNLTKEQLTWIWQAEQIHFKGGVQPRGINELKRKIERQKKRIEAATKA